MEPIAEAVPAVTRRKTAAPPGDPPCNGRPSLGGVLGDLPSRCCFSCTLFPLLASEALSGFCLSGYSTTPSGVRRWRIQLLAILLEFLPGVVLAAGEKDEKKFCFERPKYLRTESWKTPRVGGTLLLETETERT